MYTHARTHACTRTHARTRRHTQARTHTPQTQTQTQTRTRTHARARAHTHTHTHIASHTSQSLSRVRTGAMSRVRICLPPRGSGVRPHPPSRSHCKGCGSRAEPRCPVALIRRLIVLSSGRHGQNCANIITCEYRHVRAYARPCADGAAGLRRRVRRGEVGGHGGLELASDGGKRRRLAVPWADA